ncbi:MAG: hypothetical protein ACJASQ_003018 [Crocinitomicaceae bacterium]|jgi:hypothetical protein
MAERAKENGNSQAEGEQVQLKTNFFGEPSFNQPNSTVQARLKMGSSGDKYEKEADSVADRVVSNNDAKAINKAPAPPVQLSRVKPGDLQKKEAAPDEEVQAKEENSNEEKIQTKEKTLEDPVQTKCSSCGEENVQAKLSSKTEEPVQMKCAGCAEKEKSIQKAEAKEEPVQMKCNACASMSDQIQKKGNDSASGNVESTLASSKGGGSKMDNDTRSTMESGIGADFSGVKIHTDSKAEKMNQDLGAKAFTNGSDVYFNKGQYNPSSKSGQHLLAHELTHTVQQGAASETVQKKEEAPEEEKIQQKSELAIQKKDACADDDGGDKGDKGEEVKYNNVTKEANCNTCYSVPIKPSEGEKEPDGDEKSKDIEATAEQSADERQEGAPPVNDDSSIDTSAPPEPGTDVTKICDEREAKKAEKAKNEGQGEPEVKVKAEPADPEGKKKGKKKKGPKSLSEAAEIAAKPKKKPLKSKGELASIPLMGERMMNMMTSMAATSGVMAVQNKIRGMANTPISFQYDSAKNNTAVNDMANNFVRLKSESAANIIQNGLDSIQAIDKDTAAKRKKMEADIKRKKQASKTFFTIKKVVSTIKGFTSKLGLSIQYGANVSQIEQKALTDKKILADKYTTQEQEIKGAYLANVISINEKYKKSYDEHISTGKEYGKKARKKGNEMSALYRYANNPGACAWDKAMVAKGENHPDYDFWDGDLTINRYKARAESAKETGEQYEEGMVTQGQEAADKMMCKKKKMLLAAESAKQIGLENLKCAMEDGIDSIELRKTNALKQAKAVKEEFDKNLDAALKATLAELNTKQDIQDVMINDYGARQIIGLENIAHQSKTGLLDGLKSLSEKLEAQLQNYVKTVSGKPAPNETKYRQDLLELTPEFDQGQQGVKSTVEEVVGMAQGAINEGYSKGKNAIAEVYQSGINEGNHFYDVYSKLLTDIDGKRVEFFTEQLKTTLSGLQDDFDYASGRMDNVLKLSILSFAEILKMIDDQVKTSLDGLVKGMAKTINEDLESAICNEAEKAADGVEPWWKSVLKVLLIILVIVIIIVLTVVTAGAFGALASGLVAVGVNATLASALALGLAGAIFGALASFLITVGNNVIDGLGTGELTWEAAFKGAGEAALSGAIAGFIGGFAGPFIGVLGAAVGPIGKVGAFLLTEGIEVAFDVLGAVVADLVMYGEVKSWSNVFKSAIIARGIAGGVKVAGPKITAMVPQSLQIKGPKIEVGGFNDPGGVRIIPVDAPKIDVNAPKVDADAPKVESDVPKIESDAPKVEGDAPKVESDAPKVEGDAPKVESDAPKVESDAPKVESDAPKVESDAPKVEGDAPKVEGDAPKVEGDAPKVEGDAPKLDTDGPEWKNPPRTQGDHQAKKLGLGEAPEGHIWVKGKTNPHLRVKSDYDGPKMKFDPETGKIIPRVDADSVKNNEGVAGKKTTNDGHEIKVLDDGRIFKCSTCDDVKAQYKAELDANGKLRERLETIEKITDPQAKAEAIAKMVNDIDAAKGLTGGPKQARELGYPDTPEGYHWRKTDNGPVVVKNGTTEGIPLRYHPETGRFIPGDVPPWKGPAKYSGIDEGRFKVESGKDFSPAQKEAIIAANKAHNDGILRSDLDGTPLVPSQKSKSGVTPDPNEVQIDHIFPKSQGGANSISNAQVLSRQQNRAKSDN